MLRVELILKVFNFYYGNSRGEVQIMRFANLDKP